MYALRHILSVLLLPGMATVAVPVYILYSRGWKPDAWSASDPRAVILSLLGIGLIGLGLYLMVRTIALFYRVGHGTLAPWDSTEHLVVQGIYRHVRNPMISGVFCILLGEAVISRAWPLLCWFAIFLLINLIYIPLIEEPGLVSRFGEEYLLYKKNVPRWLPRGKPWERG